MNLKNKKALITVAILLVVAGAITGGIIWFRNRKNADAGADQDPVNLPVTGTQTPSGTGSGSSVSTSTSKPVSLPPINSWAWWANKLGYAGFPLKFGSKGVEVVVVQEMLNFKSFTKPTWGLDEITVDGIWGPETDTRFKLFYPGVSEVSKTLFKSDFDILNQLNP